MLLLGLVVAFLVAVPSAPARVAPVRIKCNASLAPGSTLALTEKLDLSGKDPDPLNDPWPWRDRGAQRGAACDYSGSDNDCVLLAQGE